MNELYPFQSRYFDRGGVRLHYLDEGSGPVVVMLHGNPTWSFYYRNLITALRGEYRCIVPDHIGCGLSDKPSRKLYDYSLRSRIDDLEALLDHLGVRECSLVMHDWGGMIGSAWAVRHPERVRSLVVLNTGGFRLPKEKKFPFALWLGRNTWFGTLLIRGFNLFCKRTANFGVQRKPLSPEVRAEYLRPCDSWANRIAVSYFVKTIPLKSGDPGYDIVLKTENGLEKLRDKPMLIAWGMRDFVFDRHFLAEWQRHFPDAEVMRFDDCGHYILEDAGDEIIPRVREFFDLVSRDAEALRSGARFELKRSAPQSLRVAANQEGVNVATHLARLAETEPDRLAVIHPRHSDCPQLTFRQLHEESGRLARGLEAIGISRGMRTVLMVPPSLDFFALTFALFKVGAVPVLIDPGMGIRKLGRCLAEARPEAFIGVPKAHLARQILRWARSTIRITVTTGWFFGRYSLKQVRQAGMAGAPSTIAPTAADETAAILFTSGSTGAAKGAVYTHGIFANQIEMLRRMYGIEPGEIDLSTFPLFALFGPALGMTAIVPDMNPTRPAQVDPGQIVAAIERFGVTNLFGSPALIQRVGQYGADKGLRLPTLKRVISAGAPVPAKVVERFAALLSNGAQVHTPYGATESLPVATIGSDELKQTRWATEQGCGICVGRPVEPMQVRIIPIDDGSIPEWDDSRCLPPGTIGEIAVSGPVASQAYFGRPEADALSKIRDAQTGTIWHRMGDLGYVDSQGRLWFCGRKSQRVVTAQGTLFTIPSEAVFNMHPFIERSALVGVPANGDVHPVMCVETVTDRLHWPDRYGDLLAIAQLHRHTRLITQVLFHPRFPVDTRHNAKIFREKLAIWAARQLRRPPWPQATESVEMPPTCDSARQTVGEAS